MRVQAGALLRRPKAEGRLLVFPDRGEVPARIEWVPLESVPGLIDAADMWDAGSLLALSRVLMKNRG